MKKPLTKKQIDFLDRVTKKCKSKWKLTKNGLVDIKGDFDISNRGLKSFLGIKFGKVTGNFNCGRNKLISLEGAPQEVGQDFCCSHNKLTSLVGAPQKVGDIFSCGNNELISLEGVPQKVSYFWCSNNQLTSLVGAPQEVGGDFSCSCNKLTNLEGAPKEVGGEFKCIYNQLISLKGAPQKVGRDFNCKGNKLTSLVGAPQEVGGDFECDHNKLTSLEGLPQKAARFWGRNNPISEETLKLIFKVMQTKGLEYKFALSSLKSKIKAKEWKLLSKDVKFGSEDEELGVKLLGRIL